MRTGRASRRRWPARLLLVALAASLAMSAAAPVFADYVDGFDTYTGGSSPAVWSFSPDVPSCWPSGVGAPQFYNLLSHPNVYEIFYTGAAGCQTGAHTATLTLNAQAITTSITWTLYFSRSEGQTWSSGSYFTASICGQPSTQGNILISSLPPLTGSGVWTREVFHSLTVTPGSTCPLKLTFTVGSADQANLLLLYIDNVYAKGAVGVLPTYNFAMYNLFTGTLYNVTAYNTPGGMNGTNPTNGITITVQYPGSSSAAFVAPLSPTLTLPLTGANLMEVCVTALYCNSFIPASFTAVYFVAPSQALACVLQIASPSGQFNTGTQITVSQGTAVVASGYLDVIHQFELLLPVGSYTVALSFNGFSYSGALNIGATTCANGPTVIQVGGLTGNAFVAGSGTLSYNAGWDSPLQNVVYYYSDSSITTTYVLAQLLKSNVTGTFVINSATFNSGPYGTVTGSWACHNNACNATQSAQLSVLFTATNQFGTLTPYGPVPLTVGGALPGIPGTPPSGALGGMSEFFPLNYLQLGAWFAIVVAASVFGEYEAPLGAIVLAVLAVILVGLGALPWPPLVSASIVVVAVLMFMEWREKRAANPYGAI